MIDDLTFYIPERCKECGDPFNDADAPKDALCSACRGSAVD